MTKMFIIFFSLFVSLFVSAPAFAAPATGGGVPEVFKFQVLNFTIYALIVAFIIYKIVPPKIAQKREAFLGEMKKAQAERQRAENERNEIRERLQALRANAQTDIERAREESAHVERNLITEAQEVEVRMMTEAQHTERIERERAINQLREKLISRSVEKARTNLKSELAEKDLQRLQNEFVEKIQVVRP